MTHKRIGVFEILADDGEKCTFRRLTVRCTRCGAVAERSYASVTNRIGAGCHHCPRRLAKVAIVELLRDRGPLTGRHIERLLPAAHARKRNNLAAILAELVADDEIVRYHPTGWSRTWMYAATHLSDPSTTGAAGAASASSPPSAEATASHSREGGPSRSTA